MNNNHFSLNTYRPYIVYIYQRFSKGNIPGNILHLCIFVSTNNSILPSSGIIQIIRHFYIYCNRK